VGSNPAAIVSAGAVRPARYKPEMAKTIHPNNPVLRNPKFAKEVFDASRHPLAWLIVSRRLRHSADAILARETPVGQRFWAELKRITEPKDFDEAKFPAPNFDAAHLLIGFAIENSLKGLMVAKGIATFSAQELPKILKGHDLKKLHDKAKPTKTIAPHLLDALTYMIEWRARYPLPTSIEKFWPMDDKGNPTDGGFASDSNQELLAYCDGLDAELRSFLSAVDLAKLK
jgi:hypothetical protein